METEIGKKKVIFFFFRKLKYVSLALFMKWNSLTELLGA